MGLTKENAPGISIKGFLIMMLIPSSMKGMEKSMTVSRDAVIVNGATDISASYQFIEYKNNLFLLHKNQVDIQPVTLEQHKRTTHLEGPPLQEVYGYKSVAVPLLCLHLLYAGHYF